MMRLDLARSEELLTSDFWMARLEALRGSDLILYAVVFWFREESSLTNNAFHNSSLISHNPVMRQVKVYLPLELGQAQAQKDEGNEPTVKCRFL